MNLQADVNGMNTRKPATRPSDDDAAEKTEAAGLVYVTDEEAGIERIRKGKEFDYFYGHRKITDKDQIARIKHLVIPPAWKKVWICPIENGHLQVTGYDTKARKQYRYHPQWIAMRSKTKYYRLYSFGRAIPIIRKRLRKDLKRRGLPREKVLAVVIRLMEETNIRVGSEHYKRLYGSFGLSTFKDRHVKIKGSRIRFKFIGKKGIRHDISVSNKRLAAVVRRCREIPGKDLFQYYNENEGARVISSGDVNEYIRQISGCDFTSKDFRTWAGSVECIRAFKEEGFQNENLSVKKSIVAALGKVAQCLGNSRAVCKKYYVHPLVPAYYENGRLEKYFKLIKGNSKWMAWEEKILMKILGSEKQQKGSGK